VNHNFAIEYNEVWNAALQKQMGNTSLEIGYIGSHTVHADSSTAVNVPFTLGGARPVPQLAAFNAIRWDGRATFEGMILKAARRFRHGLSFDSTYTWSKSIDDASDTGTTNAEYNLPEDPYAMNLEKALSSFDHRQPLTENLVYDFPFGTHSIRWLATAIHGWRLAEIFTAQSGAPFTINLSS
jgi:hypothetical protein